MSFACFSSVLQINIFLFLKVYVHIKNINFFLYVL